MAEQTAQLVEALRMAETMVKYHGNGQGCQACIRVLVRIEDALKAHDATPPARAQVAIAQKEGDV